MVQTRPGARGSRSAKEANAARRREDALKDSGVISEAREVHERAQAEALTCPHCQQLVHPHNWMEHHYLYHSGQPLRTLHQNGYLPVGAIRTDGGTQSRDMIDEAVVKEYAEAMADGAVFPPVDVYFDGEQYWLADGFHRLRAHQRARPRDGIRVTVHQGTQRDAILHSAGANADHGLRRTNADKRRAVMRLLRDEEWSQWSDREIARRCNVGHVMVSRIRSELSGSKEQMDTTRKVSRNGTTYTMNTTQIGTRPALPEDAPAYLHQLVDSGELGIVRAVQVAEKLLDPNIRVAVADAAIAAQVTDPAVVDVLSELHAKKRETFEVIATTGALDGTLPLSEATVRDLEYHLEYAAREHKLAAVEKRKQERHEAKLNMPKNWDPRAAYTLYTGDFMTITESFTDHSIDIIITDPPYGRDHLALYTRLGQMAGRLLKPGGSLVTLCGQSYLPEVLDRLSSFLKYQWMLAYLTPGGQSAQLWQRKVNTFWKPALWFTNGEYEGDWIGDVCRSEPNDNPKRDHPWQQSESGMADLLYRFTYPEQTILDPLCGSGTTGVVAVQMGRRFIGIDVDAAAIEKARARLEACIETA